MYILENLPLKVDIETKKVLKKLPNARAALAELKGVAATMPNPSILVNTLSLQEAKDSSAVENIITTHDELFKAELNLNLVKNIAAKEVQNYASALKTGYEYVHKNRLITNSSVLEIHKELEQNNAGYRTLPGTDLKNDKTNEVVYTPPQSKLVIKELMNNLIDYINNDLLDDLDPLIKMAVIHHQFESIHPFYDGNGRVGRIINILYLVRRNLLEYPSLYLSRYIIQNKAEYYKLLQSVRDFGDWEPWICFILDAIESVSNQAVKLITDMKKEMQSYKFFIRDNFKFYSQDLINNLFKHPYTKIDFLKRDLKVSRQTASKYLNELAMSDGNILTKVVIGRDSYFVNNGLLKLFAEYDYKL
ncbi:addiction module protein [Winogradskyella sp. J14-2]|uniref:Fic family protein n=1 Tax=Winogradskyella sp. J14-2 TaxID=1936080 RepID=UPI000972C240|nr:Fic/DOC family N-terminal domain-containing protein [Winogradskyella sp. J14-2]APY08378.1 addiction module protein [Winogradskyella sp. J14-2]